MFEDSNEELLELFSDVQLNVREINLLSPNEVETLDNLYADDCYELMGLDSVYYQIKQSELERNRRYSDDNFEANLYRKVVESPYYT